MHVNIAIGHSIRYFCCSIFFRSCSTLYVPTKIVLNVKLGYTRHISAGLLIQFDVLFPEIFIPSIDTKSAILKAATQIYGQDLPTVLQD